MTIQDAHKLNKGDKIRVILNSIIIDTEVDSISISEIGVTIWFYNWDGTYLQISSENVTYTGSNKVTKKDEFIEFLNERLSNTSDPIKIGLLLRIKEKFEELFNE